MPLDGVAQSLAPKTVMERYFQYSLIHDLRKVQAVALKRRAYGIVEMLDEPIAEAERLAEISGPPRD